MKDEIELVLICHYHDLPIEKAEHVKGAKMIQNRRLSSIPIWKYTKDNLEKAKEANEILEQIKVLQTKIHQIKKQMEIYKPN